MSATDPVTPDPTPQPDGPEFLSAQADLAKEALAKVLRDAKIALGEGVDPKEWARRYPLVTVGAALAAGFAGIYMAVPSKEEQELRKLERIRKALTPEAPHTNGHGTSEPHASPAAKPSIWAGLLKEVIGAARPIISGIISAQMAAHQAAQSDTTPPTPQP